MHVFNSTPSPLLQYGCELSVVGGAAAGDRSSIRHHPGPGGDCIPSVSGMEEQTEGCDLRRGECRWGICRVGGVTAFCGCVFGGGKMVHTCGVIVMSLNKVVVCGLH